MEFQVEDIIHSRLSVVEFHKKYSRYFKNGIMVDTAPLFALLVGDLLVSQKDFLLKADFNYGEVHYKTIKEFLKICRIEHNKIIITPQILFELLSHFQKACLKLKEDDDKKEVLKIFRERHMSLLKLIQKNVSIWDILENHRMAFLECADISFILYAKNCKHIALLTQDEGFLTEAKSCKNILSISFNDLVLNSKNFVEED